MCLEIGLVKKVASVEKVDSDFFFFGSQKNV